MSKKTAKPAKKSSKPEKEAPKKTKANADKADAPDFSDDSTKIHQVKMRDKGGKKTAVLKLIPKKGTTVKALVNSLEDEEIGLARKKLTKILSDLHKYGYIA